MLIKIGRNIRKAREGQKRTQEDVAADTGIETSYYAKVERGEANPSLELIYAILRALSKKSLDILPF